MSGSVIDTSVVIGFRNWGADRVRMAGASILRSFGDYQGEVIISDYGSEDPTLGREAAESIGARYVYTAGDPEWSRSRALNAGFAVAHGTVLVSTDADMLFSPSAVGRITERALEDPRSAMFLQCRDLPEHLDAAAIDRAGPDWDLFEREARLRPRWGMGGMMAISRTGFDEVRGFDERLHTYGGEDLDFAQRLRRSGYRTVWIDEPEVRMYHMWHPSSRTSAESSVEGKAAVEFNRRVLQRDSSFVRNTREWRFGTPDRHPLVTVAITTRNRSHLIGESILSVLAQTVRDFEIVVVDDGSTDATEAVVRGFGDSRVRYIRQEQGGIAKARNRAAAESRGRFTAVLDDDDLVPMDRLEVQLAGIDGGAAGSVGSFVNFDDATGDLELIVSQVPTMATAAEKGGAPGHGTWMVRTDLLRAFGYDESLSSGVDNDLMLRMLRAGLRFNHIGRPVLLRRRHSGQVTVTDAAGQGAAASRAFGFFSFNMTSWSMNKYAELRKDASFPPGIDRDEMLAAAAPYLPDRLVTRSVRLDALEQPSADVLGSLAGTVRVVRAVRDGRLRYSSTVIVGATLSDLATLRAAGHDWTIASSGPTNHPAPSDGFDAESWLKDEVGALLSDPATPGIKFAVVTTQGAGIDRHDASEHSIEIEREGADPVRHLVLCFESPVAASRALLSSSTSAFLLGPFVPGGAS